MALENWNEFSETVVNYVDTLTASGDPDDVFTANMAKKWITKGTENERFRRCLECGYTFQTIEAIKFDDYWKDYAKETFNGDNKIQKEEKP